MRFPQKCREHSHQKDAGRKGKWLGVDISIMIKARFPKKKWYFNELAPLGKDKRGFEKVPRQQKHFLLA